MGSPEAAAAALNVFALKCFLASEHGMLGLRFNLSWRHVKYALKTITQIPLFCDPTPVLSHEVKP